MKKILIVQVLITLILLMKSTFHNIVFILFSFIAGPFMALTYPYEVKIIIMVTLLFLTSALLMYYGVKERESIKGIVSFSIGFWGWTYVGLLYGVATGT